MENPHLMQPDDILASLERSDKSVLSGGNRLLYAPSFPIFEDRPGLWDEAHFYNYALGPLFTYAILDAVDPEPSASDPTDSNPADSDPADFDAANPGPADSTPADFDAADSDPANSDPAGGAREIPLRFESRSWRPDVLERRFSTDMELTVVERLAMRPNDAIISEVVIENATETPLNVHLVFWTCQPISGALEMTVTDGQLRFSRNLENRDQPLYPVDCILGSSRTPDSWSIVQSQGQVLPPAWKYTPFYEYFNLSLVIGCTPSVGISDGVVYGALHYRLSIDPSSSESINFRFTARPSESPEKPILDVQLSPGDPFSNATRTWKNFYDSVPSFECSDPFIEKYYNYRWFGLRMNMLVGGEDNYPHAAICEGPAYFRAPISYSAQCHILETRWMQSPDVAQGSLLNFIHNQQRDGRFIGYLAPRSLPGEFFYHANWGFIRDLDLVHPDPEFLDKAYAGLTRYVDYFDRERDADGSGLYEIHNHYETGQEYMHRYVAVDEHADRNHWGDVFRLKGVDVSIYLYEIKRVLAEIAVATGRKGDAERWRMSAARTGAAILEEMWDPEAEMFFDINPNTGERTGVKAAVCFYPYFTDLVDESHLPGLKRHLFNPGEFWTPFPVPSSSVDDPYFDADARWKGRRMNCPWNGRVWPMTNSHIAEALARSAIRFDDDELRRRAAEFMTRFIRMMFFDGDPERPNTFEHYHPFNGRASVYRGIDDYQHSWVVDLIIKYVCGIRPTDTGVVIDPFPFDIETASVSRVPVRGHELTVTRAGGTFSVRLDDRDEATSSLGRHIEWSL